MKPISTVKELSIEELKALIGEVVEERLREVLGDEMAADVPDFYLKDGAKHEDRAGEPKCVPNAVDDQILAILRNIPREEVIKACEKTGHRSFWLGPGYRYRCFCGEQLYKD